MKLNFDWLFSSRRKELKKLREDVDSLLNPQVKLFELPIIHTPYKSLRLIGDLVIVVLNDSTNISKDGGLDLYDKVKLCTTEEEVLELFSDTIKDDELLGKDLIKSSDLVIFNKYNDFQVRVDEVYIKNISYPIPPIIVAAFIEILERMEFSKTVKLEKEYNALMMFTLKLMTNPIESSRLDALKFIRLNDIRLTDKGNLVAYRGIVSKGNGNKALIEYVSSQYVKVKSWKKSPKNYFIWGEDDGTFTMYKEPCSLQSDGIGHNIGNLEYLYNNLSSLQENTYTDAHTGTMDIKIGEVYKIPEEQVDIDSRNECSSGL